MSVSSEPPVDSPEVAEPTAPDAEHAAFDPEPTAIETPLEALGAPPGAPDGPQAAAADIEQTASLPVPAGPLRSQLSLPRETSEKPSLWKRLRMRRRHAEESPPALANDVVARLDSIEHKLAQFDTTLREQLEGIHARLEEVWESEEQLSHLADIQDKLDRLARSHVELTTGIASLRRSVIGLAILVVLAAGASGLIYSSLF